MIERVDASVERCRSVSSMRSKKLAAGLLRVEPVEESGTCGADVQVTGW